MAKISVPAASAEHGRDVPEGLGARGLELWTRLDDEYEISSQDANLILEVCRVLDTIDALTQAIEEDGVMLVGSQGQMVLNGAIAERRQQQAMYARLVSMIPFDDDGEAFKKLARVTSIRARDAANARWKKGKVRGA